MTRIFALDPVGLQEMAVHMWLDKPPTSWQLAQGMAGALAGR
jgi:hypothetical protein